MPAEPDPAVSTDSSSKGAQVRADPDVVAQRLGDEVVVVHLRTNEIFILNRTGARFWELVESGSDLESVREKMLAEFEVEESQLAAELEDFVTHLSQAELINVDHSS
jgi:coenzyme PQQ synthesis protein D (PqqD)